MRAGWVILQIITTFVSIFALYLIIVMIGMAVPSSGGNQTKDIEIFVQSNGVHTDICMPTESPYCDWSDFIPIEDYPLNKAHLYIAIGWGDKGFFLDTPTWDDLTAKTALTAAFLPSPCAMHVEYKGELPIPKEMCKSEWISKENYLALVKYIQASFELKAGKVQFISGTSYWGTDHFYEAKGDYHMMNTCNSWTNGAIKSAKLKTASFAVFPSTIMHYRK